MAQTRLPKGGDTGIIQFHGIPRKDVRFRVCTIMPNGDILVRTGTDNRSAALFTTKSDGAGACMTIDRGSRNTTSPQTHRRLFGLQNHKHVTVAHWGR